MNPFQFGLNMRSLKRLRHVAVVLTQHGFGHLVEQMRLGQYVPLRMRRKKARDAEAISSATGLGRRLSRVCSELGPTFVKLGQMLSTRPDLLPPEVISELRKLQDNVPCFDSHVARQIIEEELGGPIASFFTRLEATPLASGSIGQVYRATTRAGTDVVVKVRRPDVEQIVQLDLHIVKWIAESIESFMPELRAYRPKLLVEEFDQLLTREMDYINEASTTSAVANGFEEATELRVPQVLWELTTTRVLTLEALKGGSVEAILDIPPEDDLEFNRRLIARKLVDGYLAQIFEIGIYHADPHPGNILVEAPDTVALIDFGQAGTISEETITQLVIMVYAAVAKETDVIIDALADLGALGPGSNRRDLQPALRRLLDKYYGLPLKRFDIATILHEFASVVRKYDVTIPREVVVLIKALGMIGALAQRLDPNLNLLELIQPRLRKVIRQRFTPPRFAKSVAVTSWHLFSALRQLPLNLREATRRFTSGTWQLNVKHENIDRLSTELDRSSNRLAFAVVIAAIIVGSSFVISTDTKATILNIRVQTLGVVGYLVAGVLGLGLSWAIFRSGRLH